MESSKKEVELQKLIQSWRDRTITQDKRWKVYKKRFKNMGVGQLEAWKLTLLSFEIEKRNRK